jgi:hypothetical protein
VAARQRAGNPDCAMSNPPSPRLATPDPRQRLPTTNPWSCGPNREYQPDRASCTACRTATDPADHTDPPDNKRQCAKTTTRLDKPLSISAHGAGRSESARPTHDLKQPRGTPPALSAHGSLRWLRRDDSWVRRYRPFRAGFRG